MQDIQPQNLTLAKLLNGRLFRIPDYQRAYSWTSAERNDLFEDLRKTYAKGNREDHFMATVVCLRRKSQALGIEEFQVLEVVDGQQRITTLILLLKALVIALDRSKEQEDKACKALSELLIKGEGEDLLLIQTNHDTSHYFANYLRDSRAEAPVNAKTIADENILQAIDECSCFVEQWKSRGSLLELAGLLMNRLRFILHEVEQEKTVYTVFEVLNSRGLEVSKLDQLKSILMGLAFELPNHQELIKDLHAKWKDIYAAIGLRQGLSTEALRFGATLFARTMQSKVLGEKDALEEFRQQASQGAKQIRDVASRLLEATRACDEVVSNKRWNAVTEISQARLLATAIFMRTDLEKAHKDKILQRWEKVTFRIYGMLYNDARTGVGSYVRLAWRVVNEKLTAKQISDAIGEIGKDFSIESAVDNLRNENCYEGWEKELRYFMFRYEEHLSSQRNQHFSNEQWERIWEASASKSIEHIWPKSNAPEEHKHRLGNLMLLPPGLNSRLQDDPPTKKIGEYARTGLLIAAEVVDQLETSKAWSVEEINKREEELLAWAAKEWKD